MPTKKKTKSTLKTSKARVSRPSISKETPARSYSSLLYGVLSVIVLFAIIFLGIRAISQKGAVPENGDNTTENQTQTYEVKEGDTLWSIAENELGNGFAWTKIAEENKIENPGVIEKGTKLTLPKVDEEATETPSMQAAEQETNNKITGNSYKVVRNDNLWDISVRAYGDGYKWVEIAKANNLVNPNLIHAGNVLKLPR